MIIIETCFFAGLTGWSIIRARAEQDVTKLTAFGYCVGIGGLLAAIAHGVA